MTIMDCTLRDGANVVGKGFDATLTRLMLDGLTENGIRIIELGHALGLGVEDGAPLTDAQYFAIAREYADRAELGMFMGWKNGAEANIALAREGGLSFLRISANAGDGALARDAICRVKAAGLTARYSMMKAYVLSPEALAEEAALLEDNGADELTIMDSAGTMQPDEVSAYVRSLKGRVSVPVAFHGHNNLGLASANALAAHAAGADVLDCGLMGMARSAGNMATEVIVALMQQKGELQGIDLYGLLHFIEDRLMPVMAAHGYVPAIAPIDLVYGLSGCHSSFASQLARVAADEGVDLFRLIVEVSKQDRKAPTDALMVETARELKALSCQPDES